jgi:hypothetical protein
MSDIPAKIAHKSSPEVSSAHLYNAAIEPTVNYGRTLRNVLEKSNGGV